MGQGLAKGKGKGKGKGTGEDDWSQEAIGDWDEYKEAEDRKQTLARATLEARKECGTSMV